MNLTHFSFVTEALANALEQWWSTEYLVLLKNMLCGRQRGRFGSAPV